MSARFLGTTLMLLFFSALPAWADEIPVSFDFARSGNNILAAARLSIPAEYHAYSNNPGAAGLPTKLDFTLEEEGVMPVLYPAGIPEKDIFDKRATVNVYHGDITMIAILPSGSTGKLYAAHLDMLLCSSRHCRPFKHSYSGNVPKTIPLLTDVPWENSARELLSREGESSGALSVEEGAAPPPKEIKKDSLQDKSQSESAQAGKNIVESADNFNLDLDPRYAEAELEIYSLAKALVLGLLAGLLLNAMPCVLPVLTMKVTGLLLIGNLGDRVKLRRFREHNLCFAAGILTLFTILAFLLGAADLMWGQLYQNQAVLLVMLLLVFLMGLSMLGVFTLPALDLRMGENASNPMLKSYLTGLISTFLATPCSGPLLGGVLAWAFTQPLAALLAVFWAVGLGMALPYIVFCIWPGMVKILPRPGNWMYIFEHVLGFLLLATALYLLSILPSDKHVQILCVLLVVSLCAWLWGKFCGLDAPVLRRRVVGLVGFAMLCGAVVWILQPPAASPEWREFSPQAFRDDLGKKNMLVEFTADWCPNCKFLEATVLSADNMRSWQKKYGLELVKVDLTRSDAFAEKLLETLGSKSIPLTAIFPAGDSSEKPLVLRDIYGKSALDKALENAFGKS